MSKSKQLFLAVPAVLATAATLLPGCTGLGSPKYNRTLTAQATPAAPQAYKISTGNGYIKVLQSTSGAIEISADAALQTPERRDAFSLKAESAGQTFIIEPRWPDGKALSGERCAFTIALPKATALTLQTSNGDVESAGFAGPGAFSTSNGDVIVRGHDGPVTLQTSNGKIEGSGLTASVEAGSSNGEITIAMTGGTTGPVQAQTSNGSIHLTVPATFGGTLTLSTSNGVLNVDADVTSNLKKNSGTVTFKSPGAPSSLSTSNGSIKVTQTR